MPLAVVLTRTADPAGVATSSNIATYSTVSIGTAQSDRIVWVECTYLGTAGQTVTSATIDSGGGAVAMNKSTTAQMVNSTGACFFWRRVPSGTTATIAVTYSGALIAAANHITVGTATGASDPTFQTNTSTDMDVTVPLSLSITVPSLGAARGCAACGVTGTTHTWANFTGDLSVGTGTFQYVDGSKTTSGTTTTTLTGSTNGEDGSLVIAMFAPIPDAARNLELPTGHNSNILNFPMSLRTWFDTPPYLSPTFGPPAIPDDFWQFPLSHNTLYTYPISLRTWIREAIPIVPATYMPSRVVDWGMWEDQRKALTYIAVNPALLAPAVINKPVQTIWTLPIAPPYPVDLRTFTQAPRAPDRKPPLQIIWNLPTSPVYPTDLRTWSVKPQVPNPPPQPPNDDLSLPAAPVYPVSLRTWTRAPQITVAVSLQPANQYTWSLPVAPVYPVNLRTWTVAPQAVTLNYIPSRVVEWGAPALVDFAQPWQQPLNVALLTAQVSARPVNQFDWPLPVARPRGEFTLARAPHPSGQQRPIVVSDWPLPIQPHRVIQTWLTGPRTGTGLKPVLVVDWPLPIRMAQPVRTWTQAPQPSQVVTAKPVNQTDWPLPSRTPDPVRTWIQSPNNAAPVVYIPSRVVEWGTQERQRSIDVTVHFNSALRSVAVVTLPRNQYDWALPIRIDYPVSLRSWSNAGIQIETVFRAPYYSLRWSQPYFNYDLAPFAVSLRSPVPQKPVNQYDWPLPILRMRGAALGYTFSPRAPDRMPVNQYNWPLPIIRIRDAVGYTFAPRAPDRQPVNQDDWPLPLRRTPDAITYTRSPQFGAPEQMPVNQDDWPLPIRRTREAITWTQSPNFAQQVQPRPVNNFDGSIPARPQAFMQAVQQSNIVIQAASAAARPVNNIDLSFPRRVSQVPTWFDQQTTALHNRPMPVNQDDWPLPFAAQRIAGGYGYFLAPFLARRPEAMPPKTAVFGPPIGYEYPNELRSYLRSPPSIVPAVIPPTPRRPTTKGPLWIAQPGRHNDADSGRTNISGDARAGSTMPRRYKDRS